MEIVYAAHTRSGVFMLDADGVCRWAVAQPGRTGEKVPERIVGAQYLATLDVHAEGALVDLPRIGCPMLFAATDEKGRVRLVRTPPLLRFEDRRNGPTRKPLASKFEDDATPIAPLPRPSTIPPPSESLPVPLTRSMTVPRPVAPLASAALPPPPALPALPAPPLPAPPGLLAPLPPPRTPLPPPPRARIAARIPPAPPTVPLASTAPPDAGPRARLPSAGSGLRSSVGVQSIPVRTRAANMSLKKLARGNR